MKICLIGPGLMPIPPNGWGAVEILIWDYYQTLKKLDYDVQIINTPNPNDIIRMCNSEDFDFIHIQYEDHSIITPYLKCRNVAISSHFAYLEQPDKWGGYRNIFQSTVNSGAYIFSLNENIKKVYISHGVPEYKVEVVPNGVRCDLFKFENECEKPNQSIYLAKIEERKRQYLYHDIDSLFFAGKIQCQKYNGKNYLGEWDKSHLYENLTKYANLVLLSDGEAHPLVCLEALSSGLGLVISECSTSNLDISQEFITVIPESKIKDTSFVEKKIFQNREISIKQREKIREYALNFDWINIVEKKYLPLIKNIVK